MSTACCATAPSARAVAAPILDEVYRAVGFLKP